MMFLKLSQISQEKHSCQSLFLNKVAGHRLAALLKKRLWHSCFTVKYMEILKAPFLQNTSERLLLNFQNWSQHEKLW